MFPFLKKDEPVKIRFYFDREQKRFTWGDLNTIEMIREGEISARRMMALAARFMADDKNQYLPHEKAMKILEGLNEADIADVLKQFWDAISNQAVNPTNGNGSVSPSEVGQAVGTLPDGSTR